MAHVGFASAPASYSAPVPAPVTHTGLHAPTAPKANGSPAEKPDPSGSELVSLAELEKHHLLRMQKLFDDNRNHAACKLGISIRTLRNLLHEYGVSVQDEGDTSAE